MPGLKLYPIGLISIAILIRWLVAQFPHSGYQKPPMYGDYEAQRHWMEITTNLPVKDWYKNTTDNDLLYWGLDYPPLTAYHMFILGKLSNRFNASWTQLHKSRGIETYDHRIFMRSTVILSELLVYFPAVIYYFYHTQPIQYKSQPTPVLRHTITIYCALVLLYPAQILIDHGHFQYNSVFMGLVLWAIIFMTKDWQLSSAVTFTLALCYKQMSLYYALPFFWFIASKNLRIRPFWNGLLQTLIVGLTVIAVFALMFAPFLYSLQSTLQVVQRIFPFNRGVFEDKVANFWFSLSVFYKFRNRYSLEKLLQASTGLTLLSSLPAGLHLLFRPSIRTFKYALATTSMAFFLFSFQVHEKTILVPALPILLLCREHPMAANWFVVVSTFSLQPLLIRDGQLVPYAVLMIIYTLVSLEIFNGLLTLSIARIFTMNNLLVVSYLASILMCFILSIVAVVVEPPAKYPHLHQTINSLYSCGHFVGFLLFFYYKQFRSDLAGNVPTDRNYLLKKTN
jgi:alpha-1,3-glucosyltransferase